MKRTIYGSKDNSRQEFDECMNDGKAVYKEMELKTRRFFEPKENRPEELIKLYNASEVVLIYVYDSIVKWEGGQIIRATVRDGAQARIFLEHYLKICGEMACAEIGIPIPRSYSLSAIPFHTQESEEGRRTLNLVYEANYPRILFRELYQIFVDELNGRHNSLTNKSKKWYQILLGR